MEFLLVTLRRPDFASKPPKDIQRELAIVNG
jgi:hypothetical protein